jgi:hypothetical protein
MGVPSPATLQVARDELRVRLMDLNAEIRAYPQPIARCDAQLGGLVEERARVKSALEELEAHVATGNPGASATRP